MNDDQLQTLENELAGLIPEPVFALRGRVAHRVTVELRRQQDRKGTAFLTTVAAMLVLWAGLSWTINQNASVENREIEPQAESVESIAWLVPSISPAEARRQSILLNRGGRTRHETNF